MSLSVETLISHLTTATEPLSNDHWQAIIAALGLGNNQRLIYAVMKAEGRVEELALLVPKLMPEWSFWQLLLLDDLPTWQASIFPDVEPDQQQSAEAPIASNALLAALLRILPSTP